MSIMEKNLPVADSVAEGDKVRIVTSGGTSKQVDASAIGGSGGIMKCSATYDENTGNVTLDKTYDEITSALSNGILPIMFATDGTQDFESTTLDVCQGFSSGTCEDATTYYSVLFENYQFYSTSTSGQMTTTSPCSSSGGSDSSSDTIA